MIVVNIIDQTSLVAFWLIFTRWLVIMIQLPIFDNTSIPNMVKVLTTVIISYAFYPYLAPEVMKDIRYVGLDNFWLLTAFYSIVGLLIGYFVKVILGIFMAAGSVITQQVGFDAVRYFDPQSGQEIGPFEKLINWTMLVMIISSGALLPMFKGVYSSFSTIHIYDLGKFAASHVFFLSLFKSIFIASLMLASPLIFTNVMVMTVLGIISRMVPQINIIMISFVANIGLGLLVFAATSNEFFNVAFSVYTAKLGEWFNFII